MGESILISFKEAICKCSEKPLHSVTGDFNVQIGKEHCFEQIT
jgi:hypothetical protein